MTLLFASQVAPIISAVGTLVAATVAAISARAAVRTARNSREAQDRANASLARAGRAQLSITCWKVTVSTEKEPVSFLIKNTDTENTARRVRVLMSTTGPLSEVATTDTIAPRGSLDFAGGPTEPVQTSEGSTFEHGAKVTDVARGVIEYSDDHDIGRWTQTFVLRESMHRLNDGQVQYSYDAHASFPQPVSTDEERQGLRLRLGLAWRVLRRGGQADVE